MALTRLGQARISSMTQQNNLGAELSTLYYESTRDELLSAYEWPFAIKRANISLSGENNLSVFAYMYNLPNDNLRILTLLNSEDYSEIDDPWELEGQKLLTDINPGYIKYIQKITNPTYFPQVFVEPLYLRMATKMCVKMTQDQTLLGIIFQEYMASMQSAMGILGANSKQKHVVDDPWSA